MPFPWNAQAVRLTFFLTSAFDGVGLWQKVTGQLPDTDEHRPREGMRYQAGSAGGGFLTLQIASPPAFHRLDWLMTPTPSQAGLGYLGRVEDVVKSFDALILPWLSSDPDVSTIRMAFGLVALIPVENRNESYALLAKLVPSVHYDAEQTREVNYQVNRPRLSRVLDGVHLNRLTKWVSVRRALLTLAAPEERFVVRENESQHFVTCECDNSTPDDRSEAFTTDLFVPIYSELRDLALENLDKGEVP